MRDCPTQYHLGWYKRLGTKGSIEVLKRLSKLNNTTKTPITCPKSMGKQIMKKKKMYTHRGGNPPQRRKTHTPVRIQPWKFVGFSYWSFLWILRFYFLYCLIVFILFYVILCHMSCPCLILYYNMEGAQSFGYRYYFKGVIVKANWICLWVILAYHFNLFQVTCIWVVRFSRWWGLRAIPKFQNFHPQIHKFFNPQIHKFFSSQNSRSSLLHQLGI